MRRDEQEQIRDEEKRIRDEEERTDDVVKGIRDEEQ